LRKVFNSDHNKICRKVIFSINIEDLLFNYQQIQEMENVRNQIFHKKILKFIFIELDLNISNNDEKEDVMPLYFDN
jgi:hypothetical protein